MSTRVGRPAAAALSGQQRQPASRTRGATTTRTRTRRRERIVAGYRYSPTMRPAVLLATLALAACTSLPDVRADAAHGVVWAHDRRTATETARLWDDVAPRLAALDAGLEPRPVEVWLFERLDDDNVYGGFDVRSGRVLLDAHRSHPSVTLAHELVHAYEPASWGRLPAVVREGLADWLAAQAIPETADEMRASRAVSLASYAVGGLPMPLGEGDTVAMARIGVPVETDLTPLEALRIPHGHIRRAGDGQVLKALYGMGLLIVSRAGLERLTGLSEQAAAGGQELVAPEDVLAAARLDPDPSTWLGAIEGLIAEPQQQAAARRLLGLTALPRDEPDAAAGDVRD